MRLTFKQIQEQLKNPCFERRYLGREAIRQRTSPVEEYGEVSGQFLFIDWTPEDNRSLIEFSFRDTEIGRLLLASTSKGLCFLGFAGKEDAVIKADFMQRFPQQPMEERASDFQKSAEAYCNGHHKLIVPLHVKGTGFQLHIWKQLLRIPRGRLSTYGSLISNNKGARAAGSAVGANPVSYIIPCHRVVKNDGSFQGYHWGPDIKKQLLAYEFQHN